MVGDEHHEQSVLAGLRFEEGQQVAQFAVEAVVHVLHFGRFGSVGLGDAARGVQTDVQQVGRLVGARPYCAAASFAKPSTALLPAGV